MGLETISDENLRNLAMTLRQNGLAASDNEAIRMATEMSETANKVQSGFENPKPQEPKTEPEPEPISQPEPVSEPKPVPQSEPVQEVPVENPELNQENTINELMSEDADQVYSQAETPMQEEVSEPEPVIEQESVPEPTIESQPEPKPTEEVQQSESQEAVEEEEKEEEESTDSKVDLSDVFNFGKK